MRGRDGTNFYCLLMWSSTTICNLLAATCAVDSTGVEEVVLNHHDYQKHGRYMLDEMNSSNLFLVITIVKLSIMPKYKQLRMSHTIKPWQHLLLQLFVQSVVEFRQQLQISKQTKQFVLPVICIFRNFSG